MKRDTLRLSKIFLFAALFFACSSFFGAYKRTIYDLDYFLLFWILEFLFWLGLSSGGLVLKTGRRRKRYVFRITRGGRLWILLFNILCILSFVYFIDLYRKTIGFSRLGTYTAAAFNEEGRTPLEKVTLLLMQLGGDASFLVLSCDRSFSYKWQKVMASVCLFLPGIRYLLMGSRYAIAVEALMFVYVYRDVFKANRKKSFAGVCARACLSLFLVALLGVFLYLFASRSIYYTAVEKFEFYQGDMELRPFWEKLYYQTDGKIDFLCSFSDYMAEAPYVFSYYCKYGMPEHPFGGILPFRPVLKITSAVTNRNIYDTVTAAMEGGKYAGCYYPLICDYGLVLTPFAAYFYGLVFAKIQRNKNRRRICAALMPAVAVMCFFAPIYYFSVGRLDYTVLFVVLLAPLCLRRKRIG